MTPPDRSSASDSPDTPGASASPERRRARLGWLPVAALLLLYAFMSLAASARKGPSFDECEQLAVGYDFWARRDCRMETANGDLVKRWATLPLLLSHPRLPPVTDSAYRRGEPYLFGYKFFFLEGNRPEDLLLEGRTMVALLGVATGLLIYLCACSLFGRLGGLLSLTLFVFSPHMLVFGAMVSTEMTVILTLLASTVCVWKLLHRITWGWLATGLCSVGLLMLSKLTAFAIVPITAVLIGVKLIVGRPLILQLGRQRMIARRAGQAGVFAGLIALHTLVGWSFVWAAYDFRYSGSPDPANPQLTFRVRPDGPRIAPAAAAVASWCRRTHVLPQGYLHGVKWLLESYDIRQAFLNGHWRLGGWYGFFPTALWLKTSPFLILLVGLALAGWWRWRRRVRREPDTAAGGSAAELYDVTPYVVLVFVYLGIAMTQNLDIGHRHILPIYPSFYILAGAAALFWHLRPRWPRVVVGLLVIGFAGESVATFPNYLAYFNPLAGGAAHGYKHLVDSSLDWGMDLPGLARWLKRHNPGNREPCYLAYFGTDDPAYHRIKATRLPSFFDWRRPTTYVLTAGIYAISATLLESTYTHTFGPWSHRYEREYQEVLKNLRLYVAAANDPVERAELLQRYPPGFWPSQYRSFDYLRFGRLCAWLRHHGQPMANVGHSILIWKLSTQELQDALTGPPPEMDDRPIPGVRGVIRLQPDENGEDE